MEVLKYIIPIAVGALIGYCTNYIAIKMLFRPYTEKRLFGVKLPFTPGVIPKNKPRMAAAVGKAVGENLFTGNDIVDMLVNDDVKNMVSEKINETIFNQEKSIKEFVDESEASDYEQLKERISGFVSEKILAGINRLDIEGIVKNMAVNIISEKIQGPMSMFINDSLIQSISGYISDAIVKYIDENGYSIILPAVKEEVGSFMEKPLKDSISVIGIDENAVKNAVDKVFNTLVEKGVQDITQNLDIAGTIEAKINEMDVCELEELVMMVMKHELGAVVNLGALIGAVIGVINIFF